MISRSIQLAEGDLLLRPLQLADLPAVYAAAIESLEAIKPWMSWMHDGYSIEETRSWIESLPGGWESDQNYAFGIFSALDGTALGGTGLNHVNRAYGLANLGYWVRSGRRGQGIAPRAARMVARFGFEQLGLVRAEIVVAEGNSASLRAAEKAGATREGLLRNRLFVGGKPHPAYMHSLVPGD